MSGELGKHEVDAKEGENCCDEAMDCDECVEEVMEASENELQSVNEAFMYVDENAQCFVEGSIYVIDGVEYVVESVQRVDDIQCVDKAVQHVEEGVQCLEKEIQQAKVGFQHVEEGFQCVEEGVQCVEEEVETSQCLNMGIRNKIDTETQLFSKRIHDDSNGIQRPKKRLCDIINRVDVNTGLENMIMGIPNVDEAAKNLSTEIVDETAQCLNTVIKDKIDKETQFLTKRTHDGSNGMQRPKKRFSDIAMRIDVDNVLQNVNMEISNGDETARVLNMGNQDHDTASNCLNMKNSKIEEATKYLNMGIQNVDEASQYLNMRNSKVEEASMCLNMGIPNVDGAVKNFSTAIVGETAQHLNTGIKAQIDREIRLNSRITHHCCNCNKRIQPPKKRYCDIAKEIEDALIEAGICSARRKLVLVEQGKAMKMKFIEEKSDEEKIVEEKVVEEVVEVENAYVEAEVAEVEVENAYVEIGVAEVEVGNKEDRLENTVKMRALLLNKAVESAMEVTDAESELEDFLDTITVLFNWDDLDEDLIMELGCGCGHTSLNIVKFFPTLEKLIAVDPSKSEIKLAKCINRHRKIKYRHGNILDTLSFGKYFGRISKVVSINCFQMFRNEKMGFKTIQHVLKPGGEAALFFCVQSNYFDWLCSIYQRKKWRQFLDLQDLMIPRSHIFKFDEKYYRIYLEKLGFKVIFLRKEEKMHTFKSDAECKEALLCYIFPLCLEMPRELVDQFEKECFELFILRNKRNSENKLRLRYHTLTVLFRKPDNPPKKKQKK